MSRNQGIRVSGKNVRYESFTFQPTFEVQFPLKSTSMNLGDSSMQQRIKTVQFNGHENHRDTPINVA